MSGRFRTDWLDRLARMHGERVAFVRQEDGLSVSFAELQDAGLRTAHWLRERGVAAGDRVAIVSENSLAHLFLFVACQKSGAILVPMNYRMAAPEIEYLLQDSGAKLLVQGASVLGMLGEVKTHVRRESVHVIEQLLGGLDALVPSAAIQLPEDYPLLILYTSGTTGHPKGAIVSHGMVFWNAVNTILRLGLNETEVSMNAAPFYHTGGWNVLLTPFLLLGAKTILMQRFDPEQVLECCEKHRLTVIWGVPTMLQMIADHPGFTSSTLDSVRYALAGGEAMPVDLIRIWEKMGVPIRQGFGMTEVGVNCFSLPEQDAIRKLGSIGTPNFYVDVRVVGEDGQDVGVDEVGELLMRGPVVTPGYWGNPEATSAAIQDGWFHTGDLVRFDAEGYHYVVGRRKEMYISGGENVYPAEVEVVLRQHPEVVETAVLGIPDPKWGETGVAFVVLREGARANEADLIDYTRKHLARYKCPALVRFLDVLPRGASGKVQKRDLHHLISAES